MLHENFQNFTALLYQFVVVFAFCRDLDLKVHEIDSFLSNTRWKSFEKQTRHSNRVTALLQWKAPTKNTEPRGLLVKTNQLVCTDRVMDGFYRGNRSCDKYPIKQTWNSWKNAVWIVVKRSSSLIFTTTEPALTFDVCVTDWLLSP